jgi:hypothetical protein
VTTLRCRPNPSRAAEFAEREPLWQLWLRQCPIERAAHHHVSTARRPGEAKTH